MKPPKEDPPDFAVFTPEQRAAILARVESWLGPEPDPAGLTGTQRMVDWMERRVAFQTIAGAMIAEGEVMLPGRSGMNIMARVLQSWSKQAEQVLDMIREREEKGK